MCGTRPTQALADFNTSGHSTAPSHQFYPWTAYNSRDLPIMTSYKKPSPVRQLLSQGHSLLSYPFPDEWWETRNAAHILSVFRSPSLSTCGFLNVCCCLKPSSWLHEVPQNTGANTNFLPTIPSSHLNFKYEAQLSYSHCIFILLFSSTSIVLASWEGRGWLYPWALPIPLVCLTRRHL